MQEASPSAGSRARFLTHTGSVHLRIQRGGGTPTGEEVKKHCACAVWKHPADAIKVVSVQRAQPQSGYCRRVAQQLSNVSGIEQIQTFSLRAI